MFLAHRGRMGGWILREGAGGGARGAGGTRKAARRAKLSKATWNPILTIVKIFVYVSDVPLILCIFNLLKIDAFAKEKKKKIERNTKQ